MASRLTDELRVMVDANVLVAGSIWPRWPYEVLRHAADGDYRLVLTDSIIQEAQKIVAGLAPQSMGRLLEMLTLSKYEAVAALSEIDLAENAALVRDVKDIHVALAAMRAQVDCLVSNDRDLTERYEGNLPLHEQVNVILPAVFLRDYMRWSSEALEQIRNRNWDDISRQR